MAIMTEKTLEKWAEAVANAFFTEGVTLTDGVTKVAQQENLNPEQVKRLVEAVNTATFLQKFNSMSDLDSNSQDRMVEFETADSNAVLSRLLKSAKDEMAVSAPCDDDADLTLGLPVTRSDAAPMEPKEASFEEPPPPRIKRHVVINRLHKTAEQLKQSEYQARVCFTEATQDLTDCFRRLNGNSFEAFEKDAFYHYGEHAVPHLQLLRQALRKGPADYCVTDMRKHARFVDTRTPEMRHLQEMMNWTKQRKYAEAALKKVEGDLARIA